MGGICLFLLVKEDNGNPIYKELMNNYDFMESILGREMNIITVGYDNTHHFDNNLFVSFYKNLEGEIKDWKWEDYPQIIIIKTFSIGKENFLIDKKIITMDIQKLIEVGYARSTVDLLNKIKENIFIGCDTIEDCFSRLEKEIWRMGVKYNIKKAGSQYC